MANNFIFNQKDRLCYEIVFKDNSLRNSNEDKEKDENENEDEENNIENKQEENTVCPSMFVLCKRKDIEGIMKANKDIKELCSNVKYLSNIDKIYMAENAELIEFLFENKNLNRKFSMLKDVIDMIFFTEIAGNLRKLLIVFETDINRVEKDEVLFSEINKFSLLLAESIEDYIPSKEVYELTKNKREKYINPNIEEEGNISDVNTKSNLKDENIKNKSNYIKKESNSDNKNIELNNNVNSKDNNNENNVKLGSFKSGKKNKKDKKTNKIKYDFIDQGIYAYTNTNCNNGFIPKTLFFS